MGLVTTVLIVNSRTSLAVLVRRQPTAVKAAIQRLNVYQTELASRRGQAGSTANSLLRRAAEVLARGDADARPSAAERAPPPAQCQQQTPRSAESTVT